MNGLNEKTKESPKPKGSAYGPKLKRSAYDTSYTMPGVSDNGLQSGVLVKIRNPKKDENNQRRWFHFFTYKEYEEMFGRKYR